MMYHIQTVWVFIFNFKKKNGFSQIYIVFELESSVQVCLYFWLYYGLPYKITTLIKLTH